jgi:hypothetical protein
MAIATRMPCCAWPRPAIKLVPGRAFTQQAGQPGDVGFFDAAAAVAAAAVGAGVAVAALAGVAAGVDGDLPGVFGYGGDGVALAFAQFPPDRADELVATELARLRACRARRRQGLVCQRGVWTRECRGQRTLTYTIRTQLRLLAPRITA